MGFMIFEKGKKSISTDDVVAVEDLGVKVFKFHLRGGSVIQINETTDEENKKIKEAFFTESKVRTF